MLRNLRAVHGARGDPVRLLGASERLRLASTSELEQHECAVSIALSLLALRWDDRAAEARELLMGVLASGTLDATGAASVAALLEGEEYFPDTRV